MAKHNINTEADSDERGHHRPKRRKRRPYQSAAMGLAFMLIVYGVLAYLIFPVAWIGYDYWRPVPEDGAHLTVTSDGHPGDPINVGLLGQEQEIKQIMHAAKWYPADPLGLRSDLKIAADTVLERSYAEAPVSSLYLFGRKEDMAFEKPVGDNPRQRHHVRFWKSSQVDDEGRPLWYGSATYDERVGLSHTTGQITHHIGADIDAERDQLFEDLVGTGKLVHEQYIDSFQKIPEGRNGGGDRWYTDGRLRMGTIQISVPTPAPASSTPSRS